MKYSFSLFLVLFLSFTNSFSQNYNFDMEYGGHTLAVPLHQFEYSVNGVAVDASGFVYVSDGSQSITKFNSVGTFIKRWGGDYTTPQGTLNNPEQIALDQLGNLFVVSSGDNKVVKYSTDGVFIREWGGLGTLSSQFTNPFGVAVDASNNVYVTDNTRVQKFDNNGGFLGSFTASGPSSIAVDASGNIFVTETSSNKVQKYNSAFSLKTTWGSYGTLTGQFTGPTGIACDASGNIYVCDDNNNRIQKFTNSGTFTSSWGTFGSSDGQLSYPHSLGIDASGNIYTVQYQKVQKFTNTGTFLQRFGNDGSADGQLSQPYCSAVNSTGSIYVADRNNNRIMVYNSNGTYQTKWGSLGTGNGQFTNLVSVAVDASDNVYVGDDSRIQKFTSTGTFLTSWNGIANHIAFDASGNLYCAGLLNNIVTKYSPTGTLLLTLGTNAGGSGPGQFNVPMSVDVDSYGNIYVVELGNTRVQKLSPTGTYITSWGTTGPVTEQLISPYGMIVDDENNVLVADPGSSNIKKYSSTGTYLTSFGVQGFGQGNFMNPQSISKGLNNKIMVTDPNLSNVQIFTRVKTNQTISFNTLSSTTYGASAFALSGSASSGLPLTYTSSDPTIASITGSSVTILKAGSVTITASQAGNYLYNPATNVSQTLIINKAPLSVVADNKTRNSCSANPALTYTISGFLNSETSSVLSGSPSLTTTANGSSSAGAYPIQITQGTLASGNYSFNFTNGTLQITQSDVSITNVLPSTLCTGYIFDVNYTLCGSVNSGNYFKIQLSDVSGAFGNPLEIGSISSLSSGTINCTLPTDLPESTLYKVRIISTNPSVIYAEYALPINIKLSPVITNLTGNSTLCGNAQNQSFSVSTSSSLTYSWNIPPTIDISGVSDQNSITLNFHSTNNTELIKVKGLMSNGCYSNELSKLITINAFPPVPVFTGPSAVCEYDQNKIYSIPNTVGSSYIWTNPTGSTINSASNTSQITLNFSNYTVSGVLTVQETNSLGCVGPIGTYNITSNLKPAIASISGNATPCGNTKGEAYSINTITGVTYTWTAPTNGTISSGQGSSSITLDITGNNVTGTLSVIASDNATGCVNSTNISLTYKAFPSFTGSNTIVGPLVVCSTSQTLNYYPAPNDGNSLLWTIPSYAHFVNAGDATYAFPYIVLDQYKSLPITLTIFKTSTGCSTSATIVVDTANFNPVIVGPDLVCDVPSPTYLTSSYSVVNIPGATYLWSKGTNLGTSTPLNQPSVSFQFSYANGPISLTMTYKGCQKTVIKQISRKTTFPSVSINGPEFVCNNASNSLLTIPVTYTLNNSKAGYSYKWTNQFIQTFTGNALTMDVKPIVDFQSSSVITVTEIDQADGCYLHTAEKIIKGYKDTPFAYGNSTFCPDTSSQIISVLNPVSPLSTFQWEVSTGVNIVSGNNTSSIRVKFDPGTTIAYYGVTEITDLGCTSNKGLFYSSNQSGRYFSSAAEISCATPDLSLPVKAVYLPPNLKKLEFCLNYNTQYFSLNSSTPYNIVNLTSSTLTPLTASISETTPGQINFIVQAPSGATIGGNDFLFNINFKANFTNFIPGTVTDITSCSIKETFLNGTISDCYYIDTQIKSRAVNSVLSGTLLRPITYNTLKIPLGYDSFTPSKYVPTVISGSSSGCTGLGSASYPDINGKFTYDMSSGNYVYLNRTIPASTNVTTYINSMDVYRLNLLLQGYYGGPSVTAPTIFDLLAADVNQDSKLDTADINQITRRSLYNFRYSQLNTPNKDWVFVKNSDLSSPAFNRMTYTHRISSGQIKYDPSTSLPIIPTCQSINQVVGANCTDIPDETYYGVLLGDIDMNSNYGYFLNQANANLRLAGATTVETAAIKVDLSSINNLPNGNIEVPIMVFAADTGLAFDFQLNFDQSKINIVNMRSQSPQIDSLINFSWTIFNNDELRFMGYIRDSVPLLSNYPLLYAEVNLNGNTLSPALFGTATLALINGFPVQGLILNGANASGLNNGTSLESIGLHPNPSSGVVSISGFKGTNYSYSIQNSLGTLVRKAEDVSQEQIDFKDLVDGVYYLTISVSGNNKTFKIVKIN